MPLTVLQQQSYTGTIAAEGWAYFEYTQAANSKYLQVTAPSIEMIDLAVLVQLVTVPTRQNYYAIGFNSTLELATSSETNGTTVTWTIGLYNPDNGIELPEANFVISAISTNTSGPQPPPPPPPAHTDPAISPVPPPGKGQDRKTKLFTWITLLGSLVVLAISTAFVVHWIRRSLAKMKAEPDDDDALDQLLSRRVPSSTMES